jgi:HSP20 family protein
MGIIDKVSALLPWRSDRAEPPPARPEVASLRDDLDRWLQRLLEEPGFPASGGIGWTPAANVHETDRELVVTVEVPGLERGDLDLMITPGSLVIRGEKHEVRESRQDRDDRRRGLYLAESRYGSFVRTVPLPPGLDLDRAEARIRNGMLTVRFPKIAARDGTRRIPLAT